MGILSMVFRMMDCSIWSWGIWEQPVLPYRQTGVDSVYLPRSIYHITKEEYG